MTRPFGAFGVLGPLLVSGLVTAAPTAGAQASTPVSTGGASSTQPAQDPFHWQPFGEGISERLEEGTLTVPLDYAKPDGPTIELYMVRHLADPAKRIGTLLVNPGGPGFGGSSLASSAEFSYSPDLVDRFDILGWDPRGTGLSAPAIDCIPSSDYDRYYGEPDATPAGSAEIADARKDAKAYADACIANNPELLTMVGTVNSARDIDAIRRALGEAKISYFGFSYGSELGATWATMFPGTVRAAVLDGAADPNAPDFEQSLQQNTGFENTLKAFLASCSANSRCPFHNGGKADVAFDALMQRLDQHPLPSSGGRPDVGLSVAVQGVAMAMYGQFYWPQLEQALADADRGDGAGLLALYDAYYGRLPDGTYDNGFEAFQVISCMDDAERPTPDEEDANTARIHAAAPRMAPGSAGYYFCSYFPTAKEPPITVTGKGAGPIVVLGTTGDPATPLDSSRRMAAALEDGRLVIVTADQHTGYHVNECSRATVDNYLIDPVNSVPADGTECP